MATILLYKITVSGRVQGVGFRWNIATEAGLRGIKGFVSNQANGNVYIEAEGEKEILDDFVAWCRQSPGRSIVHSVNVETGPPEDYGGFRIEH